MKSPIFLLIIFGSILLSEARHHKKHGKRHLHLHYQERELKRMKRHLQREDEKIFQRIHVSPIKYSRRNKRSSLRPYVLGQVQDVQIQIKIKTYWKDELWNRYSPQYRLLDGNIIDEVSNALIDNRNYVETKVMKFRPSKFYTLVDLSVKFFKTEIDPLHYLEGIVASGWISGLQVFSNYFKVLKIVNGNENFPAWNYPKGLRLRLHPALMTKVNAVKKVKQKIVLPANYKEIKISFTMYQRWNPFFRAKFSAPYRLLSGNVEQSDKKLHKNLNSILKYFPFLGGINTALGQMLAQAFSGSPKYLDSEVLAFRESGQGQVVVDLFVRFTDEEVYPAQKLKILVSSGSVGGTPVISDSLEIYEINNITSDQPMAEQPSNEEFPKPHSDTGMNGTETETPKIGSKIKNSGGQLLPKETTEPIYPLASPQTNQKQKTSKQPSVVAQKPNFSDEAMMAFKLHRAKFFQQSAVIMMEKQSVKPTESSKENVLVETTEPIYPKQVKMENNEIPKASETIQQQQQQLEKPQLQPWPQSQPKAKPQPQQQPLQQQQQPQQQQQNTQPQQQVQPQPLPWPKPLLQSLQQQQQQKPQLLTQQQQQPQTQLGNNAASQQATPAQLGNPAATKELWQGLPQQVEGKLVLNKEQPVLQAWNNEQQQKGNEKQLAQQPATVTQKTSTDAELDKLYKDINTQSNGNKAATTEAAPAQGATENLLDSSDTPTLTKTLYPQVVYNQNESNGVANRDKQNGSSVPAKQQSALQAAENFLSEKQDNQQNATAGKTSEAEAEAKERAEDHNAVGLMIAGVISQQTKHFKAIQFQSSYSPKSNTNASSSGSTVTNASAASTASTALNGASPVNNVIGEANFGQKDRPEQGDSSAVVQPQASSQNLAASTYPSSAQPVAAPSTVISSNDSKMQESNVVASSNVSSSQNIVAVGTSVPITASTGAINQTEVTTGNASLSMSSAETVSPQVGIGAASWNFNASAATEQPATTKPATTNTYPSVYQQTNGTSLGNYATATSNPLPQSGGTATAKTEPIKQTPSNGDVNKTDTALYNPQQYQVNTAPSSYTAATQQKPSSNYTGYVYSGQYASAKVYASQQSTASNTVTNANSNAYPSQQNQANNAAVTTYYPASAQPQGNKEASPKANNTLSTSPLQASASQIFSNDSTVKQASYPAYTYPVVATKQQEQIKINSEPTTSKESTYQNVVNTETKPAWPAATYTPNVKQESQSTNTANQASPYAYSNAQTGPAAVNYKPVTSSITTISPYREPSKADLDNSKPAHIYTPQVKEDNWPPVASTMIHTKAPSQSEVNAQTASVASTEKVLSASYTQHSMHGKMILQQSWHPLLEDKESLPYKVLTQNIQHSIEEVYSSHHMKITCKVIGLSKAPHNTSRAVMMEKVGVKFDLMYISEERAVVQTMKQAAKNGAIADLLVYPDSLSIDNETSPATSAPGSQPVAEQTTASSSEQSVVATSPMPLGNTAEAKPENMTKSANYSKLTSSTAAPVQTTKPAEPTFEFVTAPKDIPKSCEQIRDFNIGKSDGQYVLEARKGCHLSVICQNMEDKHPKEFLGGPNQREWSAYPFAALIKISTHTKENIQSGACLENSDEGRKLLEKIYKAKGQQPAPAVPWQTNIKRILEGRKRRELKNNIIVILSADEGERHQDRYPRSSHDNDADWGVL